MNPANVHDFMHENMACDYCVIGKAKLWNTGARGEKVSPFTSPEEQDANLIKSELNMWHFMLEAWWAFKPIASWRKWVFQWVIYGEDIVFIWL